jgi:hypothetical protein
MKTPRTYHRIVLALAGALLLTKAQVFAQDSASNVTVTQETYCRAETDRAMANFAKLAGGVNRWFHYRSVTPLDKQTVVRMNKDTLYSGAVVDTSKGATITVPEIADGRYFSVLQVNPSADCDQQGEEFQEGETKNVGANGRKSKRETDEDNYDQSGSDSAGDGTGESRREAEITNKAPAIEAKVPNDPATFNHSNAAKDECALSFACHRIDRWNPEI